jgi:hypothetical protein
MPPRKGAAPRAPKSIKAAESYKHSEATSLMRPDVGSQTRFKKKLPPAKYRYDDSLAPVMEWDGQNAARDKGEWLLALIEEAATLPSPHKFVPARTLKNSQGEVVATVMGLLDAVSQLKGIEKPFLNWSGKAERTSFDVPSLPLFIHERLSTKAILETLKGHKRDKQTDMFDLFGDPQHSLTDQTLKAYEYQDEWVNRMMLGDSLVAMNSLLRFEQMGGQVQMIYMDPPYGVKFGSNFQPFVRKRDVKNGDDADMTREPEMVQAYRDTWELGLHSYLTYGRCLQLSERLYHCGHVSALLAVPFNNGPCHPAYRLRLDSRLDVESYRNRIVDLAWLQRRVGTEVSNSQSTKGTPKESAKPSELLLGLIFLVVLIGLPAFIVWSVTPDSIRYPLFYAAIYQVNTAQVHVEKLPSDCGFWYAPLGDKGCHYKKQVETAKGNDGRVTGVYVVWEKVQE